MHVVSWGVLGAAAVLLLSWFRLDRALVAGLAVGIGVLIAVVWELWEYLVWVRHSPDLVKMEYADTLGDLTCDLAASVLAVALTLVLATRRERVKLQGPTTIDSVESPSELVGT